MSDITKFMNTNISNVSKIFNINVSNLSKLMGLDVSGGGSPVFLDEFTGNNGDPPNPIYWTNAASNVSIQNNELRFNNSSEEVTSKFTISGACDIRVDFNDFSHSNYQYNNISLQLYDGSNQEDAYIRASYEATANKFNGNIRHNGSMGTATVVSRSNDYGAFRIVHEGTTVTIYYKDGTGDWTVLKTGTFTDIDYTVRLRMQRVGGVVTGDFDNFTIESGVSTVHETYYGAASGDDGHCIGGVLTKTVTNDKFGNYLSDSYNQYFLFNDINIPKDSTISEAYVSLKAYGSTSGNTVNVDLEFGDIDNATEPSNCTDITNTARTSTINWDSIGGWTNQIDYDTPELKTILQTVINRSGWSSGNTVAFFADDDSSSAHRSFYTWDHVTTANKPRLHVSWVM